jgi:hypothetical protein
MGVSDLSEQIFPQIKLRNTTKVIDLSEIGTAEVILIEVTGSKVTAVLNGGGGIPIIAGGFILLSSVEVTSLSIQEAEDVEATVTVYGAA